MEKETKIPIALSSNLSWLRTMRQRGGYGGPVVHYWNNCFDFIGPGLDWRYEGLICGFLNLFEKTNDRRWLLNATACGDDLVGGQLSNSSFRHSFFENNPLYRGGSMPHEAGADIGLLALAKALKTENAPWQRYFLAAEKNIKNHILGRLWVPSKGDFTDFGSHLIFAPNKTSTICEALLLYNEFVKDRNIGETVRAALHNVLNAQASSGKMRGGIYQSASDDSKRRYGIKTYYTARCIPALLKAFDSFGDEEYLRGADRACGFIGRMQDGSGGYHQEFAFLDGAWRKCRFPMWIAGSGDILRALFLAKETGLRYDYRKGLDWMLEGQDSNGGFRTSFGMNDKLNWKAKESEWTWKDTIHVVGWNDKAFRFLTMLYKTGELQEYDIPPWKSTCADGEVREDAKRIEVIGKYVFEKDKVYRNKIAEAKTLLCYLPKGLRLLGRITTSGEFRRHLFRI